MKTLQQAREEQAKLHPYIKQEAMEAVVTMILPGRRALGEAWQKVTIGHNGSEMVYDKEATEAPEGGRPVIAMSGRDAEYTNHILAAAAEKARARSTSISELSVKEKWEAVNKAWFDFMEQKVAWGKGQSIFGPGGHIQRSKVHRGGNRAR